MHPNDLLQGKQMPKHITQQIYENPTGFTYGEVIDAYMMVVDRMKELAVELNEARELAHKWRKEADDQPEYALESGYLFPWELPRMEAKDA